MLCNLIYFPAIVLSPIPIIRPVHSSEGHRHLEPLVTPTLSEVVNQSVGQSAGEPVSQPISQCV